MRKKIYFFIGTEAELIKVFPIIQMVKAEDVDCEIISSGQNSIAESRIMSLTGINIDIQLGDEQSIRKTVGGLLLWWIKTFIGAKSIIIQKYRYDELKGAPLIVHGDTVSTVMGALLGRKLGMTVCHVEAGLRSYNIFNPFPEEIDRILTSKLSQVHFAPGEYAVKNLCKAKGIVINTEQNSLIDSLEYSKSVPVLSGILKSLNEEYFVFVMHRQENVANKQLFCEVIRKIIKISKNIKCVMIMHDITKSTLIKNNLYNEVMQEVNIDAIPRMDYFDFMKLLQNAQFVITDGGSNQEELYYMNKPCLLMRKCTERNEGLGANARLFNGDINEIESFVSEIETMKSVFCSSEESPSRIIVNTVMELLH